jgi:transcriptional regulator with XRE-family HTH domain
MPNTSSNAFQKLKDVRRRRRFIANQIKNGFAFQVRALRKARDMTQQDLAKEAETTQALISRIERDGATNLSVKTAQKIADAFDVALVVRLEPIDRLLQWVDDLAPESMSFRKSEEILADMEAAAGSSAPKQPEVERKPNLRPRLDEAQEGHQRNVVSFHEESQRRKQTEPEKAQQRFEESPLARAISGGTR